MKKHSKKIRFLAPLGVNGAKHRRGTRWEKGNLYVKCAREGGRGKWGGGKTRSGEKGDNQSTKEPSTASMGYNARSGCCSLDNRREVSRKKGRGV